MWVSPFSQQVVLTVVWTCMFWTVVEQVYLMWERPKLVSCLISIERAVVSRSGLYLRTQYHTFLLHYWMLIIVWIKEPSILAILRVINSMVISRLWIPLNCQKFENQIVALLYRAKINSDCLLFVNIKVSTFPNVAISGNRDLVSSVWASRTRVIYPTWKGRGVYNCFW
jgi:hypothetical protein